MYVSKWIIEHDNFLTLLVYYHFGKEPKFPSWYMNETKKPYEITLHETYKLDRLRYFTNCLFHQYIIY